MYPLLQSYHTKKMAVFLFSSYICWILDIYTQEQVRCFRMLRIKMPAKTVFNSVLINKRNFKISNLLSLKNKIVKTIDASKEGK